MGHLTTVCAIEGCDTSAWSGFNGMCPLHYSRWKRTGNPHGLIGRFGPVPSPPYERIMKRAWRVEECLRCGKPDEYANVSDGHGGTVSAHRAVWEHHHGAVPSEMFVCHTCDNPWCVEIDHLFLGTHAENMADMAAKGRGRKSMPIAHGQPGGYTAHKRRGEEPCDACRAVYNSRAARYARERKARSNNHVETS